MRPDSKALFAYRRRTDDGIDMTPLIDVVFQLLIFFMVSSQFVQREAQIELPIGGGGVRAEQVKPLVVEVTSSGEILINSARTERGSFADALKAEIASVGIAEVHFRGDREIPYGDFVALMEEAKSAGATKFQIIKKIDTPRD